MIVRYQTDNLRLDGINCRSIKLIEGINVAKIDASPRRPVFEHFPNWKNAEVIESYCKTCRRFVAASANSKLIEKAELFHLCPGSP